MVVAPVRNEEGKAIGAIGIVDVTGIFDIAGFMEQNAEIQRQIFGENPYPPRLSRLQRKGNRHEGYGNQRIKDSRRSIRPGIGRANCRATGHNPFSSLETDT